ncbi:unnamed protein product (mitochondrion) [Musa textilis]
MHILFMRCRVIPARSKEVDEFILCANCHLANKPLDIEVPQAVLPDKVFD